MTEAKPKRCPKCQAPLPVKAPQGLCPQCLLACAAILTEAGQPGVSSPPSLEALAAAFPQFEILELAGQGGMGFVFKARQRKLDRFVALKILAHSPSADPSFAERFDREARVLARLNHPNIVSVHDFGQTGDFFYLLMEFVDGVNLRQAMRTGRFTPAQALAIVPKICEALQFAHSEGILHRDIKPENILLDAKGRVKIADFGIAKLVGDAGQSMESSMPDQPFGPAALAGQLTESGRVLGTPKYMAPEQLRDPQNVDHRADIYSLGVVFYEMLTGELPARQFVPPSKKSAADPRVDEVVLRALEKEKEKRYSSAEEVRTRLEIIATSLQDREVPRPTPKRRLDWTTYSPFNSPEVKEICSHLTSSEKAQFLFVGLLFGIWNAGAIFYIFHLVMSGRGSGSWIVACILGVLLVASFPILHRIQRRLLCSTLWAREQGFVHERLPLFSVNPTSVLKAVAMLAGIILLNYFLQAMILMPSRPAASFGPVIQQSLRLSNTNVAFCLDLESNRIEEIRSGEAHEAGYRLPSGIYFGNHQDSNILVTTIDSAYMASVSQRFESIRTSQVIRTIEANATLRTNLISLAMLGRSNLPATYLFQTRLGYAGVFEAGPISSNQQTIQVRYKLLSGSNWVTQSLALPKKAGPLAPISRNAVEAFAKARESDMALARLGWENPPLALSVSLFMQSEERWNTFNALIAGTAVEEPARRVTHLNDELWQINFSDRDNWNKIRLKRAVALFDRDRMMLAAAAAQSDVKGSQFCFGDWISVTLPEPSSGTPSFLDFDSGALLIPPSNTFPAGKPSTPSGWLSLQSESHETNALVRWILDSGADAVMANPMDVIMFCPIAMSQIANPLLNPAWEQNVTPEWVDAEIDNAEAHALGMQKTTNGSLAIIGDFTTNSPVMPPNLCLFRTRKGALGILQLSGCREDPREVTIRYKLALPSTASFPGQTSRVTSRAQRLAKPRTWMTR